MPSTDIGLCSFGMGPLARSIIGCAVGKVTLLFTLGINDEPNESAPNWGSADKGNVQHGNNWKRWSPSLMCGAVHGGQGL